MMIAMMVCFAMVESLAWSADALENRRRIAPNRQNAGLA
jgi:hypothetical protein